MTWLFIFVSNQLSEIKSRDPELEETIIIGGLESLYSDLWNEKCNQFGLVS